jgi:hypothetical protein
VKTLILLLFPLIGYCQGYKMDMVVSRVDVTSTKRIPPRTERIILLVYKDSLTIKTTLENITLTRIRKTELFTTKNNQLYYIFIVTARDGFMIVITPVRPFRTKPLYALNIKNI